MSISSSSHSSGPPAVVGCGLTGIAISRSLSRRGIDHVLIGEAPRPDQIRLGESLNLEGTLDLIEQFPELSDCYYAKSAVIAHLGDEAVACDLELARRRPARMLYRLLGYAPPEGFLHVDRVRFDPAAFELVTASRHCRHLEARVGEVAYDAESDRILRLETPGETLRPSFVFDATNHLRLLPRVMDLDCRFLGTPQRVVYGHYRRIHGAACDEPWIASTHVLRLARPLDPVNGIAWWIPIGDTVSIGASLDVDDDGGASDEELLDWTVDAYTRRGVELEGRFEGPTARAAVPHQRYYLHERAFGKNWMLAGNTFCQVWFGTASGVAAGFAAATVAPRMLQARQRERYGRRYEDLLKRLTTSHEVFEWLRRIGLEEGPDGKRPGEAQRRGDVLVEQSVVRLLLYTGLRGRATWVGRALLAAIRRGAVDFGDICRGVTAPLAEQMRAVTPLVP